MSAPMRSMEAVERPFSGMRRGGEGTGESDLVEGGGVGEEGVEEAFGEGNGRGVGGAEAGGDFLDGTPRGARASPGEFGETAVGGVAEPALEVAEGVLVGHERDAALGAGVAKGEEFGAGVGGAAPDGLVAGIGEGGLGVEFQAVHAERGEDVRDAAEGGGGVDTVARDVEHQAAHGAIGHKKAPLRRAVAWGALGLCRGAHRAGAQGSPSVRRR